MNSFTLLHVFALFVALCIGLLVGCMLRASSGKAPFAGSDMLRNAVFDSTVPDDLDKERDPWVLQQMLMHASDQPMAQRPTLTDTSLLYLALLAEESSETYEAAGAILGRVISYGIVDDIQRHEMSLIAQSLGMCSDRLKSESKSIRNAIARLGHVRIVLTDAEAVELFDGTTDVAVVNCGLAVASGFDGSAGYLEVVGSNLSKVNPATKKIDKTPDGKWIKGPNYFKPDLMAVIRRSDAICGFDA